MTAEQERGIEILTAWKRIAAACISSGQTTMYLTLLRDREPRGLKVLLWDYAGPEGIIESKTSRIVDGRCCWAVSARFSAMAVAAWCLQAIPRVRTEAGAA